MIKGAIIDIFFVGAERRRKFWTVQIPLSKIDPPKNGGGGGEDGGSAPPPPPKTNPWGETPPSSSRAFTTLQRFYVHPPTHRIHDEDLEAGEMGTGWL